MRHFNQRGDKNPTVLKTMWLLVKIGLQRSKRRSKENRQEAKALARWIQGGDKGGGKKWMDGKMHIWKEELKGFDMRWEGKRNQVPLPDFGLEKLDKWLCYY